jgi:hypothetical protein
MPADEARIAISLSPALSTHSAPPGRADNTLLELSQSARPNNAKRSVEVALVNCDPTRAVAGWCRNGAGGLDLATE